MKKFFVIILVIAMTISFSACGKQEVQPGDSDIDSLAPKNMAIATGNSSGTVYYIGAGMSKILNDSGIGIEFTAESTSGAVTENCNLTNGDYSYLATAAMDGVIEGFSGDYLSRDFDNPVENIRMFMVGHLTTVYMASLNSSNVYTVSDFKGKNIGWPTVGTSCYYAMNTIIDKYGLKTDDFKHSPISISDQVDAMKDGQLDVFSGAGAVPMAGITELMLSCDAKLISLDNEEINKEILKTNPSYQINSIPPGTYKNQDSDIKVLQIPMILICNKDLDEDTAYRIAEVLYSNNEELANIHSEGIKWSLESTKPYYENPPIPFHPGVKKFLDEQFK